MAGYRAPYTQDEEKAIVQYIVKKSAFNRVKGRELWQEMEASGKFKRTWQSLKEHFRKKVLQELHFPRYELDPATVNKFQSGSKSMPGTSKRPSLPVKQENQESSSDNEDRQVVQTANRNRLVARKFAVLNSSSSGSETELR